MCFLSGRVNLIKKYINEVFSLGLAGSRNLQVTMCNLWFTVCKLWFTCYCFLIINYKLAIRRVMIMTSILPVA